MNYPGQWGAGLAGLLLWAVGIGALKRSAYEIEWRFDSMEAKTTLPRYIRGLLWLITNRMTWLNKPG
jgi:hypothetical protein